MFGLVRHAAALVGLVALAGAGGLALTGTRPTPGLDDPEFTENFFIEDCQFSPNGANRFFSLRPGYRLHLAAEDEGGTVDLFITVLEETRTIRVPIDGRLQRVRTRVIEERELVDGELFEVSRNYYARDTRTNDIYYFGEDVCFYENDVCVGTDGSWLAGVDGATPGIIMPGTFLLGARYFQEQAPGVAMDRAEHAEMGATVEVVAGAFENCVVISESSSIDPNALGEKVFAPDVGFIMEGELQLVWYGFGEEDDFSGGGNGGDGGGEEPPPERNANGRFWWLFR